MGPIVDRRSGISTSSSWLGLSASPLVHGDSGHCSELLSASVLKLFAVWPCPHLISTCQHSCDECSTIFITLPLLYIIVNTNLRNKNGVGLGTRLVHMHEHRQKCCTRLSQALTLLDEHSCCFAAPALSSILLCHHVCDIPHNNLAISLSIAC